MEIKRSVLVPYASEEMFDLIEQAEHYPLFLPWCVSVRILERSEDWVAARIDFKYLQVRFGFQTRNPKQRPHWLKVRMVEGPFRRFEGDWLLTPLGQHGCRINFDLSYEVSDGILDRVAARGADLVSRSMLDAFVKRAEDTLVPVSQRVVTVNVGASALPDVASTVAVAVAVAVAGAATSTPRANAPGPDGPELSVQEATTAQPPSAASGPQHRSTTENAMTTLDPALLAAVRACPLAQELSPEQAAVLASLMRIETYAAHQVVAQEGSSDNRLCVVAEGTLSVIKQVGSPEESLIVTLNPGDFAHELGFLDGAQRYASLVATSASRVLVLEREALESLIESHPMILYRVMCAIVRTVHRIQTRLSVQASELTNYIVKQHGRY